MTEKDVTLDRMLVKISHLDRLLGLVGEVIITSNSIATTNRRIQEHYDRKAPLDKLSMDMIKAAEESSNRISSDLHGLVMDIRMVEIKGTFQRFRRPMRDMAKEAGKEVEFVTEGEDTLVDKTIAEKLYDPINHQIRNAIDHGVEDPFERQRAGKPAKANVLLKAYQRENNIYIEIRDDGRGMDPDAIARAAVARGLASETETARLSPEDKLRFIFQAGFSTKEKASTLSGRGVGMDVVRSNIEELGGEVVIDTRIGQGSVFIYKIPQVTAVNILDCLTVRSGANLFAAPILNVVSTVRVPRAKIHVAFGKGKSITHLGNIIPLHDLNELLGESPLDHAGDATIVILEAKKGRLAVEVSEFLAPEKLVYTPLGRMFHVQGVSGVTVMSGNKMGLVIDAAQLLDRSRGIAADVEEEGSVSALVKKIKEGGIQAAAPPPPVEKAPPAVTAAPAGMVEAESFGDRKVLSSDVGREIAHREEFLMELEEMLNAAGGEILSLEQNPNDRELLNRIFRAFHSMKGNLMMVGLTELGSFIHEVEAILDRARSGDLTVDSEIVDILLDGADVIGAARQALAQGKAPSIDTGLLKTIEKFKKPLEKKEAQIVDVSQRTFHLGALERFNLLARRQAGQYVYQVFLSFKPEYQQPFLVALLILRRLSDIGLIFGSVPAVEEIENQSVGTQLKVMFASQYDSEKLKEYVESRLVKFYDVTDFEILKTF
ncbi:MAG: chemotaxis protein CheW [Nitrospinae bacterium]|nr:chemotaxis protein CheW [Nitrospinota bacterium]